MKHLYNIVIVGFLFMSLSSSTFAQSGNLSGKSDKQIAEGLLMGSIKHTDVPFERNSKVYTEFRRYLDQASGTNGGFYTKLPHTFVCDFLLSRPGFIEIEDKGDIYTWPIAFQNKENDGYFVMYTDQMKPENAFAFSTNIFGMDYSMVQTKMNMMKIGKQKKPILDVLNGHDMHNALVINPRQAVSFNDKKSLLLSYSVTYAEKPTDIIYTKPTYVAIAGQLFEVDNGIHYEIPLHDIGYLSLVDTESMNSIYTVALDGVAYPSVFCFSSTFSHLYCGNNAFYNIPLESETRWRVLSKDGTPIYILSGDGREIITKVIPGDGDVVFDMVETEDYIIYCGSNTKHGYVGYDNPTLVVVDKKNNKEVARYNSRLGSDRKGKLFCRMILLPAPNNDSDIYIETRGVKGQTYYGTGQYSSDYGKFGRDAHGCYAEVVRLSSLLKQ